MFENIECSAKVQLLFAIIAECGGRDEKILVFSQNLYVLDVIEHFLGIQLEWKKERDYFRLDGSTPLDKRKEYIDQFNGSNSNTKFVKISHIEM